MQSLYLDFWRNLQHSSFLVFETSVLNTFRKYRQNSCFAVEAGGILIGRAYELGYIIKLATEPQLTDHRYRMLFERFPIGHQQIADTIYRQSHGKDVYLGEWHTHFETHPIPSTIDREEWRVLAVRRGRLPLICVIVGTEDLHVELVRPMMSELFVPVSEVIQSPQ